MSDYADALRDRFPLDEVLREAYPETPVYLPAVQVPPTAKVIAVPGRVPYYAHQPAPLPPYDPLPQRMYGCGVMAFGILAGAGVAEAGSYWMFAGMALATHALIGIGATFVAGAVAVVALRLGSGVRISNFHQGDNSTFQAGHQR